MITYEMIDKKIDRLIAEGFMIEYNRTYDFIRVGEIVIFQQPRPFIFLEQINISEAENEILYKKLMDLRTEQKTHHTQEEIIKYLES